MGRDTDEDADAARIARARFRDDASPTIRRDRSADRWLHPGEQLVARRDEATLDRRGGPTDGPPSGMLLLTTERLFLVGSRPVSIPLDQVEEAALLGERVVLLIRGGVGVTIKCAGPRLLRVQIAAARAARTAATLLAR